MIQDSIMANFLPVGYLSKNNELYLPIGYTKDFLVECKSHQVAVIGVEFFHRVGERVVPVNPIKGIDCSVLFNEYLEWTDLVDKCYINVLNLLSEEEETDKSQWCNFTLLEETDWI